MFSRVKPLLITESANRLDLKVNLFCLCFASSKILWRHMRGRYHYIVNTGMITGACLYIMIVLMHIVDLALLCLAKFGIL